MDGLGPLRGSSRDEATSGSRSGDRCRSESGFGCVSNDTVPDQYKTFHTKDEIDKLLQKEMNEALSDALIKQIELQRDEAKKAQKTIDEEAEYFTKVFKDYKGYVAGQTSETDFSTKLQLLEYAFTNDLPLLPLEDLEDEEEALAPITKKRTLSTSGHSDTRERDERRSGPSNSANTEAIFKDAINRYKRYLLNTFVYGGYTITTPWGFNCGAIKRNIEDAFRSLYPNGCNIFDSIPCIRIKSISIEGQKCELFLTITKDKIELICNLKDPRNPVYQCAFYRNGDGKSLLFIAKITGKHGFRNAHITLVLPIRRERRINNANPHMTFTHNPPEVRIYFKCSEQYFNLPTMLKKFGEYIAKPRETTIEMLRSMNAEHIKQLENVLDKEMEKREEKRIKNGGSTNKILKIKEQIKIIRGKYKTTKLDKYLIQIDKLKEKIEQLKLKEKKNKIKEQIKEVKALHKLNPKKAYVNKMIKLKEKLNNM